jgi:hypothetical protein
MLAEVSVAFAGFASVVVVFRRRDIAAWSAMDAFRFRGMLVTSLLALSSCLVPLTLGAFSLPEPVVWGTSSAFFLIAYAGFAFRTAPRLLEARDSPGYSRLSAWIAGAAASVAVTLQALNLFGIGFLREPGPHIAGTAFFVLLSGYYFFRLVTLPYVDKKDAHD